jgi:hypothetical protein
MNCLCARGGGVRTNAYSSLASLLVIMFCLVLTGCLKRTSVSAKIGKQLQPGASQLDMRSVTNFIWDDMYVFGPYTPNGQICRTLKHAEAQCSHERIRDVDEYESLIVFVRGASVTRMESLPRTIADFDHGCLNKEFKRDAAVLSVHRRPACVLDAAGNTVPCSLLICGYSSTSN